jgi:NitT/TauT family transport system substrate-binding protein
MRLNLWLQKAFATIIGATCAAALMLSPMKPSLASNEPIPIKIGLPITNYWPAYIARDLKLFEKVGLKPEFYGFQTGAPLIAAMKSGSIDVAWTGLATLFMLGQDIPLKFILVPLDSSSQMAYVVNPSSGIQSYKDIAKSKNIGAPTATCSEVSLVLAAKAAGVDRSQLKTSNLAPNLLLGALKNGQIDSAFIWGPWNISMREAGYKIANYDKDFQINGGVCATAVTVRPAFLEANPSVGCKLIKAHALSLEAAKKDSAHAIRTMEETFNIPLNQAKETYETLVIPTIASQLEPNAPWSLTNKEGGLSQKLKVAADALYEAKAFAKPLSKEVIANSVESKYVEEFLKTNCE